MDCLIGAHLQVLHIEGHVDFGSITKGIRQSHPGSEAQGGFGKEILHQTVATVQPGIEYISSDIIYMMA